MKMKNLIINNCLSYIKKYNNYDDIKLKEIEYGLVSIYLTITKLIIIFGIAIYLKIFKEVIIFSIMFNILRAPAFGLHATKSWICLITSTLVFIGIPILCINVHINVFIKVIMCSIGILLMFKNAPADTKKRPIVNKKRRMKFKIIATSLTIIFSFLSILIKDNFISNSFMSAIIVECFLISPIIYRLFKLPYNNYINFLNEHPDFAIE